MFDEEYEIYLAKLLRSLLDCSLPPRSQSLIHSAPYTPSGRPNVYYLARARRERMVYVDTRCEGGGSMTAFTPKIEQSGQSSIVTYRSEKNPPMNHADGVFAFEIDRVTAGTDLSTKLIAQRRAEILARQPLWLGAASIPLHQAGQDFFRKISSQSADANFWLHWYQDLLNGTYRDWEFAAQVVLIPDSVWEEGLSSVGLKIRELQREQKTQVAPRLVEVSEGTWDIEKDVNVGVEPMEFAIGQVEVALMAALAAGQNNGLREDSGETVQIRSACEKYRDNPSIVATSFWSACMSLDRNIGDLYPEDGILIALKNTLYTSVGELCEQDDLIKSRIGKLAALKTQRYPTQEEKDDLAQVPEEVSGNTTPEAQEQLQEMVDIVVSEQKPPRITRARLVNWITTLGVGIDKAQKHEKRGKWLLGLARRIGGWFFGDEEDNNPEE